MDWNLIRIFLAVVDEGSFSGAARRLSSTQPTIGRSIKALEKDVGFSLFKRHRTGFHLTEAGEAILVHARRTEQTMAELKLSLKGGQGQLRGTVRITASNFVAHMILPPLISELRNLYPDIAIELVPSDREENLVFGQADIAIRMFPSRQLDVVTKKLGTLAIGVYAAQNYLAKCGEPRCIEDLRSHHMIGFDRDETILRAMRSFGFPAERSWFSVRSDDHALCWSMVRAGCGIGFFLRAVGDKEPTVRRLLPDLDIVPLNLWLAAHEKLIKTPSVRAIWDHLEARLKPLVDLA